MDPESDEEYTYDQEEQEEYAYSDGEDELSVSDVPMVSSSVNCLLIFKDSLWFALSIQLVSKTNLEEYHSLLSLSLMMHVKIESNDVARWLQGHR